MSAIRLTLTLSGRTIQRHEFEDVQTLKVGRAQDCDVLIDNLGVSRCHCEIVHIAGVYQVHDKGSNNGTYVNGTRLTAPHNLNSGDVISIGKFGIRFEAEAPPIDEVGEETVDELDAPLLEDGLRTLQMDPAAIAKRSREAMSRNSGFLTFADGSREVLLDRSLFTIGKGSDCDVLLSGWLCPRLVALIIRDESGFRLIDVSQSARAVRVNGLVRRDGWLNDNDEVEVRGKQMTFHRGLPVGRR